MKYTTVIILILVIFSCQYPQKKVDNDNKEIIELDSIKTDSILTKKEMAKECFQKDTVTAMGTSIKYSYENEGFRITWSDSSYKRSLDSLFHCDFDERTGTWDFVPKYIHETKNTVVLQNILYTSSGGNPAPLAYSSIILPKNTKGVVIEKYEILMTKDDYLVYATDLDSVFILNLETNKEQTILLKPRPLHVRSPTISIEKPRIEKKTFYLEYNSLKKVEDDYEEIRVKKSFKIKI
ncbi:hypothetical protein [Bernardetia sp. MNP-M8]|uniref:hypothetical protein n=1 Tax=Bernardetia sp. MNP-M8 TaxID=3127470 RepID=UPI0030D58EB9